MLTRRRAGIAICIAIAVCIALVPVADLSALALLTPVWWVFAFVLLLETAAVGRERRPQPLALVSNRPSRAPPRRRRT